MKIRHLIVIILKESYRWRKRGLIEEKGFVEPQLTKLTFIWHNIIVFAVCLILSLFLKNVFSINFSGHLITAFSIFIGLFSAVLILVFDKFVNHSANGKEKIKSIEKLDYRRTRNFSRKFIFISLESLLIAIASIVLLLICMAFHDQFNKNVLNYELVFSFKKEHLVDFLTNFAAILTRTLLLLLIYKFFKYLLYVFGSLGSYFKGILDGNVKT